MKMQFCISDRQSIEHGIVVRTPYVVISIRDPGQPRARIRRQSGLRAVLYIAFHDAEPVEGMTLPPKIVPMATSHAEQIWAFVREHQADVGTIVVHCEQGMSRSPAVAAALCKALGGDDASFWREYQPNLHVYRLMLEAHRKEEGGARKRDG